MVGNGRRAVGNRNARQRVVVGEDIREAVVMDDCLPACRIVEAGQRGAALERLLSNGRNRVRQLGGSESGTALESIGTDSLKTGGEVDCLDRAAALEGIVADVGHAVRQDDVRQVPAISEHRRANGGYALAQHDLIQRPAASERAAVKPLHRARNKDLPDVCVVLECAGGDPSDTEGVDLRRDDHYVRCADVGGERCLLLACRGILKIPPGTCSGIVGDPVVGAVSLGVNVALAPGGQRAPIKGILRDVFQRRRQIDAGDAAVSEGLGLDADEPLRQDHIIQRGIVHERLCLDDRQVIGQLGSFSPRYGHRECHRGNEQCEGP